MANVDLAFGFVATPLLRARPYSVGATNSTILYINDVVALEATGNMVSAAAASTLIIGSCLGYTAASTGVDLPVADAANQEFHAQDDGSGAPAQTDIGNNADHLATAGSTYTRLSAHEIDHSSVSAAEQGFTLLDFVKDPDAAVADFAIWRCISSQSLWTNTAGI